MIEVICYDKIKKQKFTLNYRDLEKLRKFYNKFSIISILRLS